MRTESSVGIVVPVTAAQIIATNNCVVTALTLNPAAAACTVILYDPLPVIKTPGVTAATPTITGATVVCTLVAPASVSSVTLALPSAIECKHGLIAVVTGLGATASLAYAVTGA